jgi:hypothetical protein
VGHNAGIDLASVLQVVPQLVKSLCASEKIGDDSLGVVAEGIALDELALLGRL